MQIFNRLSALAEVVVISDKIPGYSLLNQKYLKIAGIAGLAIALFAALYVAYRYFWSKKQPPPPSSNGNPISHAMDPQKQTAPPTQHDSFSEASHSMRWKNQTQGADQDEENQLGETDSAVQDAYGSLLSKDSTKDTQGMVFKNPWDKHNSLQSNQSGNQSGDNAKQANATFSNFYNTQTTYSPVSQGQAASSTYTPASPSLPDSPPMQTVPHPRAAPILSDLDIREAEIGRLKDEIQQEQDILSGMRASAFSAIQDDAIPTGDAADEIHGIILAKEAEIQSLTDKLHQTYGGYPAILEQHMTKCFTDCGKMTSEDHHEIYEHLVKLANNLKDNKQDDAFVFECLKQIDCFLTKTFFTSTTEACIPEDKKAFLISFQHLFEIVDEYYSQMHKQDPALALRLKIKLGNLPLVDGKDGHVERATFSNIYMDEEDQRAILLDHFQLREDEAIDDTIAQLASKRMTAREAKRFASAVVEQTSDLSKQNIDKLRAAFTAQMGRAAPQTWDNLAGLESAFNTQFVTNASTPSTQDPYGYYPQPQQNTTFTKLKWATQAKKYFEAHAEIPRWYHATWAAAVNPIITSGKILVLHKKAFEGAWVSNQREPTMGDNVFVFRHRITEIDPKVRIEYEYGNVRWRGLKHPIPLIDQTLPTLVSNVAMVGLSRQYMKSDKDNVIQWLKSIGIDQPTIVSTSFIDYMQKEILLKIGNPNLTQNWWGKANVQHLDQPLPKQ